MMSLGKQSKTLNLNQQKTMLSYLKTTRKPLRNKVIFQLSFKSGLRSKEISNLKWSMVTDSEGNITDCISLTDIASKGKSGGVIWLNKELKLSLIQLWKDTCKTKINDYVIKSERNCKMSPQVIVNLFFRWYKTMGFEGCSSHSGRRTFITMTSRKISSVGGSIRDVQSLARHSSLSMTQKYIENDIESMKKVVNLI
jgi:integrase